MTRGNSRWSCAVAASSILLATWIGCQEPSGNAEQQDGRSSARERDDTMSDAEWSALKASAIREIRVAEGWEPPQLVRGPVNSTGWEDSASISPDGTTLHFAYIPVDLHSLTTKAGFDLAQFDRYRRGPDRGVEPPFTFDVFSAEKTGEVFGPPEKHRVSVGTIPPYTSESGLMEAGGSFYYNGNSPASPADHDVDIYRDGVRLPFNTDDDEQDPHFIEGELFFWSDDRPGVLAQGRKNLFLTRQNEGRWTDPVPLVEPVNSPTSDSWQCHLTRDGLLYFTSNRDGPLTIFASRRQGTNVWETPEKVVWPAGGGSVIGVAEPSLTADGRWLYFCVLFRNPAGCFDLDIAFTRRR